MKVIKSNVEILGQEPGIIGMKKHIERCARTSYKSEDRITEDSYVRFLAMLEERGHWSCFEFGTVYMRVPDNEVEQFDSTWTKKVKDGDFWLVTTNYRLILQRGLGEKMEQYWMEPDERFNHRVTSHWICSRLVSHQLVRHRCHTFIQASQRYINYSKEKFGSGITYILPQWIYDIRAKIGTTVDPQTYQPRDYILSLDGEELWRELCCWDRTVSSRDDFWRACEREYLYELSTDEGEMLKPEDARGVLCNDTMTELCMCAYISDLTHKPVGTTEKSGFFTLRSANSAQRDIRVLSQQLEVLVNDLGLEH